MAFSQTPGRFNANDFKAMLNSKNDEPTSLEKQKSIKSAPKRHEPKKKESKGASNVFAASKNNMPPPKPASRFANTPYRDRAAERQAGTNNDYADDAKLLEKVGLTPMGRLASATPMGMGAGASKYLMTPSGKMVNVEDFSKLGIKPKSGTFANPEESSALTEDDVTVRQELINEEIEKSKLLGGDEEHTHLVKGLDFVLLAKERAKAESKRVEEEKQKDEMLAKIKQSVGKALDQKKSSAAPQRAEPTDTAKIEFKTTLGRTVFGILSDNTGGVRSLSKLKGASFVFDLSVNSISDVPTTTFTSNLLGTKGPVMCRSTAPESLLQNISYIIDQKLAGAYGKEKMRKQRAKEAKKREEMVRREQEKLEGAGERLGMHLVGEVKKAEVQTNDEDADSGGIFSDDGGMSGLEESSDSDSSSEGSSSPSTGKEKKAGPVGGLFAKDSEPEKRDTWDGLRDLQGEAPREVVAPQPAKLARLSSAPVASAYGECFPDTYAGPDLEGFAAGLNEVDEGDIEREEEENLRLDQKGQKREQKRKKQAQEHKIKLELQRMEVERKKRAATPDGGSSKRPKTE